MMSLVRRFLCLAFISFQIATLCAKAAEPESMNYIQANLDELLVSNENSGKAMLVLGLKNRHNVEIHIDGWAPSVDGKLILSPVKVTWSLEGKEALDEEIHLTSPITLEKDGHVALGLLVSLPKKSGNFNLSLVKGPLFSSPNDIAVGFNCNDVGVKINWSSGKPSVEIRKKAAGDSVPAKETGKPVPTQGPVKPPKDPDEPKK